MGSPFVPTAGNPGSLIAANPEHPGFAEISTDGHCLPMELVIFTLASARSGTLYLRNLFQNNLKDCVCRHEPFFDWGNPTLFGPAIYDAYAGRWDRIRERLANKRAYI